MYLYFLHPLHPVNEQIHTNVLLIQMKSHWYFFFCSVWNHCLLKHLKIHKHKNTKEEMCDVCPQAREDIIILLKSNRTRPETLEAHYGSSTPIKPLQALQRDGLLTLGTSNTEDVYETPMAEVSRHWSPRNIWPTILKSLFHTEKNLSVMFWEVFLGFICVTIATFSGLHLSTWLMMFKRVTLFVCLYIVVLRGKKNLKSK